MLLPTQRRRMRVITPSLPSSSSSPNPPYPTTTTTPSRTRPSPPSPHPSPSRLIVTIGMPPFFNVFMSDPISNPLFLSCLRLCIIPRVPSREIKSSARFVSPVFERLDFIKGEGGEGDAFDAVRELAVDARARCLGKEGGREGGRNRMSEDIGCEQAT